MSRDLVVGELSAAPGDRARGFLTVGESPTGITVRVPVLLVNGEAEGPTLVVVSGVHGDDLNTIPMVWRIARESAPETLRGRLIAIPVANPLAFESGAHLTPADHKSPAFPGNERGTVTERMSHRLYEHVVRHADYLIDMHGGSRNATLAPLAIIDGSLPPSLFEVALDMAEAFGPELIVLHERKRGRPQSMAQAAAGAGAPSIYVGMGRMGFNEEDTARGTVGVFNIMRYLKMLKGAVRTAPQPAMTRTERYHYAPVGGCFFPAVAAGDEVRAGDRLGDLHDLFGTPIVSVRSQVDGVVDAMRNYPVVTAGAWIASVARWPA